MFFGVDDISLKSVQVTKIVWANTTLPLVASGVEFAEYTNTTNGTTRYTAHARKEVIVAAGALRVGLSLQRIMSSNFRIPLLDPRDPATLRNR